MKMLVLAMSKPIAASRLWAALLRPMTAPAVGALCVCMPQALSCTACTASSRASVSAGLDVYENEASIFFSDFSQQDRASKVKARDNMLSTLQGFPNVLITPHSAFLTTEALRSIADTTVKSLHEIAEGKPLTHQLHA